MREMTDVSDDTMELGENPTIALTIEIARATGLLIKNENMV